MMMMTFKVRTYAKLNFLKLNYFHKNGFGVKKPTKVDMP